MFILHWIKKFFQAIDKGCLWVVKLCWRLLQLSLLACLLIGVIAIFKNSSTITPNTVLVLDLKGEILEQTQTPSLVMSLLSEEEPLDTSLHDILSALKSAQNDPMIQGVLLKLDKLDKAGLASISEIGHAVEQFKQSGKPVYAWGSHYSQTQYAIAAHAHEIYMHPMGEVAVKGLSSNRLYFGDFLKKLGVNVHVFKAGDYKSYPEAFTANAPSEAWMQAESTWLNSAWKLLANDIESSRGLMPGSLENYINTLPERVRQNRGDMAQTAMQGNLIDGTKTADEMEEFIKIKLGKGQKAESSWISYLDYANGVNSAPQPESIAVILAEGQILDGESEPGIIGSDTLAEQISIVRHDPNVKAVVLRINSPGGSAVASEIIRHELELLKKAGKPIVVSMADVAASGGYWISAGGSKIVASPMTITGSIGVFGLLPTFENTLSLAHIGQGSVSTTWLAGADKTIKSLDPRLEDILTQNVARTYDDFTKLVAQSRHLSKKQVHAIAQGRVWTGNQAYQYKLIDKLGYFEDAVSLAKDLAKLPHNAPVVFYEEDSLSLSSALRSSMKHWSSPLSWLSKIYLPDGIEQEKTFWEQAFKQNKAVYAHSFIQID